ncbi:potassium-transporting ATPase subunit KdpC [Streptomyces sp. NBC_01537]|uniref:potassium-transporting ATPase subunit KdpC n=1 Tax=Streptomyces sp. NBC_01537 TaxID=2903896 RepID=UPI0038701B81
MRTHLAALRMLLVFTVITGIAYPLAVTGIAQAAFSDQANGSIVKQDGRTVGSSLIGQKFAGTRWFEPRPSAGGYDPLASGATNLGPNSPELVKTVQQRRSAVAKLNGVAESQVPADAVTASGSGLDPDISTAYASIQVNRVAEARGLSTTAVRKLVAANTHGRALGFLGEEYVNVVELNLALVKLG